MICVSTNNYLLNLTDTHPMAGISKTDLHVMTRDGQRKGLHEMRELIKT